jgi:hypothetical protein
VAALGNQALVVWSDLRSGATRDVYGARISADGVVLDPDGLALSTAANQQENVAVASNGTDYLVAWEDLRGGGSNKDIYGTRVTTTGMVLEPTGLAINTSNSPQFNPAISSDGTEFLVVWNENRANNQNIYGARVSGAGSVMDSPSFTISDAAGSQLNPALAFNGTHYFVAWQDTRGGAGPQIYGARVGTDGVTVDAAGIPVATVTSTNVNAAVASVGTEFMVVWEDFRAVVTYDIYGTRVDATGAVLNATGFVVSAGTTQHSNPTLTRFGAGFFAAWEQGPLTTALDVRGTRLLADGTVQDASGLAISTSAREQGAPSVAVGPQGYLVVWEEPGTAGNYDVKGMRLDLLGERVDATAITISNAADDQRAPHVAAVEGGFWVVWEDHRLGTWDIRGSRVNTLGQVQEPTGTVVNSASGDQRAPRVACTGATCLVVWEDGRVPSDKDIFNTLLLADGTVVNPAGGVLSNALEHQTAPSVVAHDTGFFVAWQDFRSGNTQDVYGARLQLDGTVLDTAGLELASGPGHQKTPVLATNGTQHLVVWEYEQGATFDVLGVRVGLDGALLDAAAVPVANAGAAQVLPTVAWAGTSYMVAWEDRRTGVAVRLNRVNPTNAALLEGNATTGSVAFSTALGGRPAAALVGRHGVLAYRSSSLGVSRVMTRTVDFNRAPTFTVPSNPTTPEGTTLVFTVSATDADGDVLTYVASNLPAGATFDGATRTLTWLPGFDAAGTYPGVHFEASDGESSASLDVIITVTNANPPPVFDPVTAPTVAEGQLLTLVVNATDPDLADVLTYSAHDLRWMPCLTPPRIPSPGRRLMTPREPTRWCALK